MTNKNFYKDLVGFKQFAMATDNEHYQPLPKNWHVVVTDIRNSTQAIENNQYKDVNIIGASCIIAVLNTLPENVEIPFVFGGDGATFAIPEHLIEQTSKALVGTKHLSNKEFNLDLRIGIVPVQDIIDNGKTIKIAKYQITKNTSIAMFSGGGLALADDLIKKEEEKYCLDLPKEQVEANFNGLECRWNPVKASKGQMLTLLVKAQDEENSNALYKNILNKIDEIYGSSECYQPNNQNNMSLTFLNENHKTELKLRTSGKNALQKFMHRLHIYGIILLGTVTLFMERKFKEPKRRNITNDLLKSTDFQKFDDTLRMVLDSSPDQIEELTRFLNTLSQNKQCIYGTHISDEALITCMIFNRSDRHLHFIDGAQGGYALAAKKMKEQQAQTA